MDSRTGALTALSVLCGVAAAVFWGLWYRLKYTYTGSETNTKYLGASSPVSASLGKIISFLPAFYFLFGAIFDLVNGQFQLFVTSLVGVGVAISGYGLNGIYEKIYGRQSSANITISDIISQCTIPGWPLKTTFSSGNVHASVYIVLLSFYTCMYIGGLLTNNMYSPGNTAGYAIISILFFGGVIYRYFTNCNSMFDGLVGTIYGSFWAGIILLIFQQNANTLVPFTPIISAGGGSATTGGAVMPKPMFPGLNSAGPSDQTQCAKTNNQEFVCHAYKNGKLIA